MNPLPRVLTSSVALLVYVLLAMLEMGHPAMVYTCTYTNYNLYYIVPYTPADINDCELELDTCSPNAACTNTMGSFECECLLGFFGDGMTCEGQYIYNNNVNSTVLLQLFVIMLTINRY